ncbi:hypothetical protein AAVH_07818 [Aphelenchoides avenae]|nr:hypothetical protein AAVH_07818 [Aphelenchus avenae]
MLAEPDSLVSPSSTPAAFGRSDALNEASLMADLHLNGPIDKEAVDELSRSVLNWKLKAIDLVHRVGLWERRNFGRGTLKEGFNASLEFDGRVRDVFVKVHHMRPQSPSSNIEVHVTYFNEKLYLVLRHLRGFRHDSKYTYLPVHVSTRVYIANQPAVEKNFLESLINYDHFEYWHELVPLDEKALENGTYSCEVAVDVQPLAYSIETIDMKVKMLQQLQALKHGQSDGVVVPPNRINLCPNGKVSVGLVQRWCQEFGNDIARSGTTDVVPSTLSVRIPVRLAPLFKDGVYIWRRSKNSGASKEEMDQHSPDSGACTGSDTELAEHDLEKVDLAEEAVEEGDTELKLATATSTLSFSNLVPWTGESDLRSPPAKRSTPDSAYDDGSEFFDKNDRMQGIIGGSRTSSQTLCVPLTELLDDAGSPIEKLFQEELPHVLDTD